MKFYNNVCVGMLHIQLDLYTEINLLFNIRLKCMIATCEEFAKKHQITFNPTKSKLLCFNACDAVTPHIKLNGQPVSVVHKDKHLGNYISDSIHDRHILNNICDLYQRSNLLISQFRSCDSETLDRLHKTYCMHMYGCELWNLSCSYINGYKVAWRKIKRRIWNISPRTDNNLVSNRVGVKYSTCTWYLYLSTYLSVLDVLEYLVYGNVLVLVLDQKVLGTYK